MKDFKERERVNDSEKEREKTIIIFYYKLLIKKLIKIL